MKATLGCHVEFASAGVRANGPLRGIVVGTRTNPNGNEWLDVAVDCTVFSDSDQPAIVGVKTDLVRVLSTTPDHKPGYSKKHPRAGVWA